MRQEHFVARHQAEWQAFEGWLDARAASPRKARADRGWRGLADEDMPAAYRRLSQQLGLARRRGYSPLLLERLQEDESLRGDLEDPAATALLDWASARIRAVAADPQRGDEALAADAQAIRQAARAAARMGISDPQQVVTAAAAALQQASPREDSPAPVASPVIRSFQSFRRRRPTPRFGTRRAPQKEDS